MPARTRLAACAVALALVSGPAWAQDAAQQTTLDVGLEAPDTVRAVLEEHVRLLKRAPIVLPEERADRAAMVRRARREVADLLATEGYFSPRIRFDRSDARRWVLQVEPGERTEIAAVDIEFEGELAESGEGGSEYLDLLRASWGLPVGEAFRQSAWDSAKQSLLDTINSRRYAAARIVASRAEIDPETAQARLSVRIDSGPSFYLGRSTCRGWSTCPTTW